MLKIGRFSCGIYAGTMDPWQATFAIAVQLMKTKALGITLISLVTILAIAGASIQKRRAANDKLAATPTEKTAMPMSDANHFTPTDETSFDGQWWKVTAPQEQVGFIDGYYDCYKYDAKARTTANASDAEFQKAVSNFYEKHQDQLRTSVPTVLRDLVVTFKSPRVRPQGGEVWNEPHGYYDGQWWKESEPKEQIGYLEGYLSCYSHDVRRPRARFSKRAAEYQELIIQYYDSDPKHTEDDKIAYVLYRVRDKRTVH